VVRLGAFLALIGFGSSLLHFTDIQLRYLIWAEPNQPWLGVGIGGVGAVLLLIHTLRGKDNAPEQAPAAQGAYGPPPGGFPPPAGFPPPGGGFAPAAGAPGGFAPQSPPVGFPAAGPAPQSPPQGFAPPAGYGAQPVAPGAIPQQGPPVGQWQQQGPPQPRGPQGPPQQFGPQSGPPRG
jgi:hypothetical protein